MLNFIQLIHDITKDQLTLAKLIKVMVIRHRGASPKLGTSQWDCPYPCTQVCFGGEDDEGGGDEVVGLSSGFQCKGSPSKDDARVSQVPQLVAKLIPLNLASYSKTWFWRS